SDPAKSINLGQAAHIMGARLGAKRYDPSMTDEQRRHISNGIWLCTSCASEIDKDERKFTVELLHRWKADHEQILTADRQRNTQELVKDSVEEEYNENDVLIIHEEWISKHLNRLGGAINFCDVDRDTGFEPGTAKKYLEIAAKKWNYEVDK